MQDVFKKVHNKSSIEDLYIKKYSLKSARQLSEIATFFNFEKMRRAWKDLIVFKNVPLRCKNSLIVFLQMRLTNMLEFVRA